MTKRPEDDFGTLLTSEFGKVTDVVESGGRNGTTIIVEELFSNVPARKKFLKKLRENMVTMVNFTADYDTAKSFFDTIIKQRLNSISFDNTILCTIIEKIDKYIKIHTENDKIEFEKGRTI